MKNLFKKLANTAQNTKKEYNSIKKESTIKTITCNFCGAPRPKKSNLTTCAYCNSKFMDINTKILSDV